MNEEFPVSASHQLALITSLPFVHTARRYYRSDGLVRPSDRSRRSGSPHRRACWEEVRTWSSRGSKSRNKVSVGEPAEGSLSKAFSAFSDENWIQRLNLKTPLYVRKQIRTKVHPRCYRTIASGFGASVRTASAPASILPASRSVQAPRPSWCLRRREASGVRAV